MIKFLDYTSNEKFLELLNDIRLSLSVDYQNEVHLSYKGKHFSIEPVNGKCVLFFENNQYIFENFDELFLNFKFEGKSFIDSMIYIDF